MKNKYVILLGHHKIEINGGIGTYFANYDSFVNGQISDTYLYCPFCGTWDFEVSNTHTPIYTIECSCGCEMTGEYFEPINKTKKALIHAHQTALQDLINKWEDRV